MQQTSPLSFPREFFYDHSLRQRDKDPVRPCDVNFALETMPEETWVAMCRDLFPHMQPNHVNTWLVLQRVRETNTCRPGTPVVVYIDPEGRHTVSVHFSE